MILSKKGKVCFIFKTRDILKEKEVFTDCM